MFDDRLEIYSPGGVLDGCRVQDLDFRNVSSRRRNPIIADIFNRLKYMDRRGGGFKKILDSYEFQEHHAEEMKPEFKSRNNEFWLIFKNLNYNTINISTDLSAKNADKDGAQLERILQYLSEQSECSCRDICMLLDEKNVGQGNCFKSYRKKKVESYGTNRIRR